MFADPNILFYIPIVNSALAVGGIGTRLILKEGPARQALMVSLLVFILLLSAVLWQQNTLERKQVRKVADEIVKLIGNHERTYDEIVSAIRRPNYEAIDAAIELLIEEKRLDSRPATVVDEADQQPYRIRLFFRQATQSG